MAPRQNLWVESLPTRQEKYRCLFSAPMGWEGTGGKSRGFLADSPLMARIFGRTEKRHRYSEYGSGKIFRFSGGRSLASKAMEHLLVTNDPQILARNHKS